MGTAQQIELFPTDLHLTCIDREANKQRYYHLSVQPTLFGEWALVCEWGRIGRRGQWRSKLYPSAGQALDGLHERARLKGRRGYSEHA